MLLLSSADIFQNLPFQNSFKNTIRVPNGSVPDQERLLIFACWVIFFMLLLSSADNFQNKLFQKVFSGTLFECQMIQIQIRTDIHYLHAG